MLSSLRISNYALIRDLDINLGHGFNVVTGETGAGKTILLGAVGLILGNRAESEILLDKSSKCVVEAVFEIGDYDLEGFFKANDLDYEKNCIIRREILPSGKSRAFINDTPVNLDLLREMGGFLVEIHSQHSTVSLFKPSFQLSILDDWAGLSKDVAEYQSLYLDFQESKSRLKDLVEEHKRLLNEQEFLQFQFDELSAANLKVGEKVELMQELEILQNAEEITEDLNKLRFGFESEDETPSALEILQLLSPIVDRLSALSSRYDTLKERFHTLRIEMDDLSKQIIREADLIELDPERLESVRNRLDMLNHLEHKHGVDEVGLTDKLNELETQLTSFVSLETQIEELKIDVETKNEQLKVRAEMISSSRKESAKTLESSVTDVLKRVNLTEAAFNVDFETQELGINGIDKVHFHFSAHKGIPSSDLSKMASGGELSRIMLALKSNITAKRLLPTIIFDEIDNGVSGETATLVGRVMHGLSDKMQVISITHQPSIAAYGKNHYLVFKEMEGDTASSKIKLLVENERVEVLAGMLSGGRPTEAALKTAKELLSN